MRNYKATGVVLHTLKYGDNSLVVFMLTDLKGRASFMVRGVKSGRGGNKLALFQPMFVVEFEAVSSPKAQMDTLRDVHSALPLESLPFDIVKSTIALFMAEVLYRLVRDVEPESPLFDFVCNVVQSLDEAQSGVANFHLKFMVELARHMGFYPSGDYREGDVLDIREGVFVGAEPAHGAAMSVENSRTLARFMQTDFDSLDTVPMNRTSRDAFLSAMLEYFDYHLDSVRNIRSVEILRTVFG
ncbi:MAG: DNA repair protein RecO [Rikenellaceae bacterium]|nr:DNA repair protein RecO [Rikenellaceae bacterium]